MNISHSLELFRQITKDYFGTDKKVIFGNQSRNPKPNQPLVVITTTTFKRPLDAPILDFKDKFYPSILSLTVDLFTNGTDIFNGGVKLFTIDSSLDEMLSFKDYLESEDVIERTHLNDISIIPVDVTLMTGIVNDTTYQYRSRMNVNIYFTHNAISKNGSPVNDN